MLTFNSSFLQIKLICDKENMLILNTCSFQMLRSDLLIGKCILEGDGFKDSSILKLS